MKKIMLDFGHGAHDSGAIGVNGVKEKDVVLEIGNMVIDKLKKSQVQVHATRTTDVFVTLSDRAKKANDLSVDIFVSLHCNSFNGTAKGLETYAYAAQYNKLATNIQNQLLGDKLANSNRGVKYANFQVLRETNMDACLVELGFIDNIDDYNLIINNKEKFATSLAKGICKHLGIEFVEQSESEITVGSKVRVIGTHYATGQLIPDWVKKNTYTVSQIKDDRALLKEIASWVFLKDLTLA